jgi:hypothetical protein
MNIKNKLYAMSFLLLLGTSFLVKAAVDTQKLQEVRENVASQAAAIKQLTGIVNGLKQKLGVQADVISTDNIEPVVAQATNGGVIQESQELNNLLTVAKNQSITLNKLADTVVRLQHHLGIQPGGVDTTEGQSAAEAN